MALAGGIVVIDLFRSSLSFPWQTSLVVILNSYYPAYINALWATLLANTLTMNRVMTTITMSGFLLIFFSGADLTYMRVNGSTREIFNFYLKNNRLLADHARLLDRSAA